MKKEQFISHIKRINKLSFITSVIIIFAAFVVRYAASPDEAKQYMSQYTYTVIFLLILVHLKANNLKQRAIIRYMTNSISDT